MQVIGQGIIDRVDLRVCQQLLIGAIYFRDAKPGSYRLASFQVPRRQSRNTTIRSLLHGRNHRLDSNIGGAQDAPANFIHQSLSSWLSGNEPDKRISYYSRARAQWQ